MKNSVDKAHQRYKIRRKRKKKNVKKIDSPAKKLDFASLISLLGNTKAIYLHNNTLLLYTIWNITSNKRSTIRSRFTRSATGKAHSPSSTESWLVFSFRLVPRQRHFRPWELASGQLTRLFYLYLIDRKIRASKRAFDYICVCV